MLKLNINTKTKKYPIIWLDQISDLLQSLNQELQMKNTIMITNEKIYDLYQRQIAQALSDILVIRIPDGESQKNINVILRLSEQILQNAANRSSVLLALGGGVIGDITGFLASIYMRGISYIQIPTTLLSMVDSSVGGKTGINLKNGKNMIGSFYQPEKVFICIEFLETLPDREILSGLAEVVKSALISNRSFFHFIVQNVKAIQEKDPAIIKRLSYESIKVKKWVIQKDEKEKNLRAILNLGHTLAHAIESHFNYSKARHGEAVSLGLSFSAYYSFQKGLIIEKDLKNIQGLLSKLGLPFDTNSFCKTVKIAEREMPTSDKLMHYMEKDKKNYTGSLRFIFLQKIGKANTPQEVKGKEIKSVLTEFLRI